MANYFTKTKDNSTYALYKGNDNVMDGTLEEIAEATGKTVRNLKRYTWKSYNEWLEEKDLLLDRNPEKRISLVLLERDKEVEKKYRYKLSIPEEIYKHIIAFSEKKKNYKKSNDFTMYRVRS